MASRTDPKDRYSKVNRRLWTDEWFVGLGPVPCTPHTVWFALLTALPSPVPGLAPVGLGWLCDLTGWDYGEVLTALAPLEKSGRVVRSTRPVLIWLPKAINHNQPASPNTAKSWGMECAAMPECLVRSMAVATIAEGMTEGMRKAYVEGCGIVWDKACARVCDNQEQEQEQEQERTNGACAPESVSIPLGNYTIGDGPHEGQQAFPVNPLSKAFDDLGLPPPKTLAQQHLSETYSDTEAERGRKVLNSYRLDEEMPPLPKPAAPSPVLRVWASWRELNPTAKTKPTSGQRVTIKARLNDHSVEELTDYFRWIRESGHERAVYCRKNNHDGFTSVMRPSNADERMPWVREWTDDGAVQAPPTEADGSAHLYSPHAWLESAMVNKAHRENLTKDDITVDFARRAPGIGSTPEWAILKAVERARDAVTG